MPRIFDNIDQQLLPALCESLRVADRADFCVGYFNLRGWRALDSYVERWSGGEGHCCRLLVGMQRLPQEELRDALRVVKVNRPDNQTALRMKRQLAEEFRNQLMAGCPTNEDEAGRVGSVSLFPWRRSARPGMPRFKSCCASLARPLWPILTIGSASYSMGWSTFAFA